MSGTAKECQGPLDPRDRNSGLSHAQAGCGIVQSGAASQVVPRLRSPVVPAGGRAELLDHCYCISRDQGRVRWQEAAMNSLGLNPGGGTGTSRG